MPLPSLNIYVYIYMYIWASQVAKNLPANAEDTGDTIGSILGWRVPPGNSGGKISWRRALQPIPIFLPGESHGERTWAGTVHSVAKSQIQLKCLSMHGDI